MSLKHFAQNHWPSVAIAVTAAVVACATLVMLWNMPPRSIVMATGPQGGTYYEVGERYRAALAEGIARGAAASCRRPHRAFGVSARRRFHCVLSNSEQVGGTQRRGRFTEG